MMRCASDDLFGGLRTLRESIATAVRHARMRLELSPQRLAGLAGVDVQVVGAIESPVGERDSKLPERNTLLTVLNASGVSLDVAMPIYQLTEEARSYWTTQMKHRGVRMMAGSTGADSPREDAEFGLFVRLEALDEVCSEPPAPRKSFADLRAKYARGAASR